MSKKMSLCDFINRSVVAHNNEYDYSLVDFVNTSTKVKIICKKHGLFEQTPVCHYKGNGCPQCYLIRKRDFHNHPEKHSIDCKCVKCTKTLSLQDFLLKCKKVHGDTYDYSKVAYTQYHKKVCVICTCHGEFWITPSNHLNGNGCKKCAIKHNKQNQPKSNLEFISDAKSVHGCLYDYSKVNYINNIEKIIIVCKKHGVFEQIPTNHLAGNGCPKCKESHGERKIRKFLDDNFISYIRQKTFDKCVNPKTNRKLKFDFYLPDHNMCIEFDGEQHFNCGFKMNGKFVITDDYVRSIKYRDELKNVYCFNNNINLIRIKNNELIEQKIKDYIHNG